MAKFYTLSPATVPENPHLFPMLRPFFSERGHSFVLNIEDADIVLFDLHSRIGGYSEKDIDWAARNAEKIVYFDEWDRGGLSVDKYPLPLTEQQRMIVGSIIVNGVVVGQVHFCRLLDKTATYRGYIIYPYEKSIIYEEKPVSADELFEREYDIVWIANTAPQREKLKQILEADGRLKTNIILGAQKIPFQDWINEHKKGKLFISWSGGGFSDERMQALFSIAGIIRENNNQLLLHDFEHLKTAIRPNPIPTKEDIDTIVEIVNDKRKLHDIYMSGCSFMKDYYSPGYIANDILSKIEKHLM